MERIGKATRKGDFAFGEPLKEKPREPVRIVDDSEKVTPIQSGPGRHSTPTFFGQPLPCAKKERD